MRLIGFLPLLLALGLFGCGDDGSTDSGTDTSTGDTSPPTDTSTGDTSPGDTGPGDTGPADTSVPPVDTGPPPACESPVLPGLATEEVAAGDSFSSPLFVDQAPGNSDTLWVVERGGRIRLVRGDSIVGTFLDISGDIDAGGEQGLLGLAFHPGYASNGRFFVYYTENGSGANVVAEYAVSSDPDVADGSEVRRLIDLADRQGNHNGGMIAFGPDGFLYVGTGDEGGGCDRHGDPGNGQDTTTLHGKLLRLDVDNMAGAFVAAGNPFEGGGGLPQIWAYGLRNPWRFSIDQPTGDIYIGDVGQNAIEEIDIQPGTSTGGENYGWRFFEGDERSSMSGSGCDDTGFDTITHAEPAVVNAQSSGGEILRGACSITGGYVYRGSAIPALAGVYFYGDYCSNDIAALRYCEGSVMGVQRVDDLRGTGDGLASFGQDNAGELYLVFIGNDEVHRIIPAP